MNATTKQLTARQVWDSLCAACRPFKDGKKHGGSHQVYSFQNLKRRLEAAGFKARELSPAQRRERHISTTNCALVNVLGRELVVKTSFMGRDCVRLPEGIFQIGTIASAMRMARKCKPGGRVRAASITLGVCMNPCTLP